MNLQFLTESFKRKLFLGCSLLLVLTMHTSSKGHKWIPNTVKIQFAGGIGFISPGVGYTFMNQKLDLTAFYGFVPKSIGGKKLNSLSIQGTFKMVRIQWKEYTIMPLNFGFFLHHTFGGEYWVKQPAHYPKDYYWWSPGRLGGIFIGGEIQTTLLSKHTILSGTSFYTRIGTRGLYAISYLGNPTTLKISDILEVGLGIAIYLE